MSKLYPCKNCGREVPIRSKGLCPLCRERQRIANGEETALSKKVEIPKITDKTKEKNKKKKAERDVYFAYHLLKCKRSEESGVPIPSPTRANICHILPKSTHNSVQANLQNVLYLTFREHERFDKLLFEHRFDEIKEEFKNSWPIALERLKKVLPLCRENTKLSIELKKQINNGERSTT